MNHQCEILTAVNAIEEYWSEVGCESPSQIQSRIPTRLWQGELSRGGRYESDVLIFHSSKLVGKIDLLDVRARAAFQLRCFGEAPQTEFSEDVLKVALYNRSAKKKIRRLVFITRTKCARELNRGFGKAVCEFAWGLGFEVAVVGIGGEDFE